MDKLLELIKKAFEYIKNIIRRVINGILNFAKEVVARFKSLGLTQGQDIPFVANKEVFKNALKTAPVKKVGIFEGVYNEVSDEITFAEYVEADSLDAQTRNVLGQEELVVLS